MDFIKAYIVVQIVVQLAVHFALLMVIAIDKLLK
jgi:hypothetical protein